MRILFQHFLLLQSASHKVVVMVFAEEQHLHQHLSGACASCTGMTINIYYCTGLSFNYYCTDSTYARYKTSISDGVRRNGQARLATSLT